MLAGSPEHTNITVVTIVADTIASVVHEAECQLIWKRKWRAIVTEGEWLGSGDPALVFQPDLESLTLEDEEKYIQHLQWSRAEVLALVGGLTNEQIEAEQNAKERSIRAMLEHEWEHLVELSERLDKPL